ncbi:MinD/ParA family protein [Halobacillus litoralis]|uniref:MinD/ParA family protein n=1 Tax=Halobacillus litoralis TaxID=45668 RepID=UPI001CFCF920|nr:MinD/ParA family protein [Halobacillus litoralis]
MKDQAEMLRSRMREQSDSKTARTIAVVSGKGGVGKSNFSVNFALELIKNEKRVLLFDLDIGMGNIDILLGLSPAYSFVDLFEDKRSLDDIIEIGPHSLSFIAGGSGLSQIFQLDNNRFEYFQQQFDRLLLKYDYILFDMGAGATEDSLSFIRSSDEVIVVTTPEPTSMTDGYAMIKHLVNRDKQLPMHLLVNRTYKRSQGTDTFDRLQMVSRKFLQKDISLLGVLPDDQSVLAAVHHQQPFCSFAPKSQVSRALKQITLDYLDRANPPSYGGSSTFIGKLKRFVFERERR